MATSDHEPGDSIGGRAARAIGQGIWMLIPVVSISFLAWVPAAQAYWRARTAGWLLTTALLLLASGTVAAGMATDADGAGLGLLFIGAAVGGVAAAGAARNVVFGRRPLDGDGRRHAGTSAAAIETDPAMSKVLQDRERRRRAREIVANDPAMAWELEIGRPDLPAGYADGGLVDLNNVPAAGIVQALGWDPEQAELLVADRDARRGYSSVTELGALSGVDPGLLDADAERIVLLPYRAGRRPGGRA